MTKKIMKFLAIIAIFFVASFKVNASSVPSSITVSSIGKINYGGRYNFPVKYTSDGTLAYCTEYYDQFPMGIKMTNPKKVDSGIAYIIANGYKGTKNDYGNKTKMKQYYITQLAIYTYLGQANPKANNDVHKAVWDLVNNAKKAAGQSNEKLNVKLNTNSTSMNLTKDGNYFISDAIKIESNRTDVKFNISASQNVKATVIDENGNNASTVKAGNTVYVKIPSNTINAGQSITLSVTVNGTATKQTAYVYTPSASKYQNIAPGIVYPENENTNATIKVTAAKEKIVTEVKISKQDITTKKELAGATLVIKDANGKEVISWVSDGKTKSVKGLTAGNYTLCETKAPDGYELYTECIKFTVKADGTPSTVIMYNAKKSEETKVTISKQDITTKEELKGAKLRILDKNDKELISWVSDGTPKLIKGLAAGTYYLEETQAPSGYILATEKKQFEVKEDGTMTSIIFYNELEKKTSKVAISKQDMTTKEELPGATLIIKDETGKEIDRWVSTTEVHYVTLEKGTYTLTEVQAPDGYVLSTETITFTVNENGEVDKQVIMYNTKAVEVPITASNASVLVYLIGALGMIFGFTKVFKNAKLQ